MLIWSLLLLFCAAMAASAIYDLAIMQIPNWLTAGLALSFLPYAALLGAGWGALAVHVLCAFVVLLIVFGFFAAGWMGGGDAKLIAAVALWLGPGVELTTFLLWSSVFGGALTLALLIARACLSPATGLAPVDRLLRRDTGIPYGVALAAAGLMVVPDLWATIRSEVDGPKVDAVLRGQETLTML